jgi:TRAP-type C4-dicarboxylate transport system substrate-binding protein
MKFRPLAIGLLAAAAALVLPGSATEAEPAYVLNFGTVAPDGTPWSQQLQDIKTRVEEQTDGKVQIKLFLGGSMGAEVEITRDIRRGERLQGGGMSTAAIADGANVPLLQLPELPYLFRSVEEADVVLDEVLLEPVSADLKEKGFIFAGWAENGWRSFATKGPMTSLDELKGYKMRSQESPVHTAMYTALGVPFVTKPTTEVLSALSTGIVDGFDNTPLFSVAAGLMNEVSHYNLSRHIYQPAAVVYSARYWEKMPADIQEVVLGDVLAESKKGRVGVRALETEMLDVMRGMGVTVAEVDSSLSDELASKTAGVHQTFLSEHPDLKPLYDQVQAKLGSMR